MARKDYAKGSEAPWQMLAHAIIIQACDDYRNSYRKISRGLAVRNEEMLVARALSFFGSSWYAELTEIDSGYLVRHLRMDVVDAAREDYRAAWRQVWQKGRYKKRDEIRALERFFQTDRFRRLSGQAGARVIEDEKQKAVAEMLERYRELSGREGQAEKEQERIREFMRSEDFGRLCGLDPEKLILAMES